MTNRIAFDSGDVDELCRRFSVPELRHEARQADVHASVCRTLGEDDWEDFYRDYQAICELGIDILLADQPKPKHSPSRLNAQQVRRS